MNQNTLAARIDTLLDTLELKKVRFAEKIKVDPSYVTQMTAGKRFPSDRTISDICREFNVNEHWLRTGEGEMFNEVTQDDRIAEFVGEALAGRPEHIKRRMLSALSKLREEDWDAVDYFVQVLLDEKAEQELEDKKED